MKRLKILTWHVHGNYLYYLSQVPHDFYVPYRDDRAGDYTGILSGFPWPDSIREVPADAVRDLSFDCILFQRRSQFTDEQFRILSPGQRRLPKVYLEHDPPQEHPTNTRHFVDDPGVLLVHVTPFNQLMWDSGRTPNIVIDHGVIVPGDAVYTGSLPRGIAVVNNISRRGRRLGSDVLNTVRRDIPVDLAGMGAEAAGGIGEVPHDQLPYFEAKYRFFFNPIRYTSLGLAVCEAMMIGMPILGLATTEMSTVIQNGITGHVETDLQKLIARMRILLADPSEARRLGRNARAYARERFSIDRFVHDWQRAFALATGMQTARHKAAPLSERRKAEKEANVLEI